MGLQPNRNLTKLVVSGTYTIPAGASLIHIANLGASDGFWTGDMPGSDAVPLAADEAYEFPSKESDNYGAILIDATNTTIKVSIIY
jgi:hypothetical protein